MQLRRNSEFWPIQLRTEPRRHIRRRAIGWDDSFRRPRLDDAKGPTVYDKQALMTLLREKALKFGEFTLASGKKASYYLDGKQVTLDAAGARLLAEGILDLLPQPLPKSVGGMAIGADPITGSV